MKELDMDDLKGARSRTRRLAFAVVAAAVVVALALGLGLGLGLKKQGDDDDSGSGNNNNTSDAPISTFRDVAWPPKAGASWQIILIKPLEIEKENIRLVPDVDIYDLDLYDNSKDIFDGLHSLGRKVICYFSAGSYEDNRPDSAQFPKEDIGSELDGWPGEFWLNLSSPAVRSIMSERIKFAKEKGCDGIDPDNVDGFQNENGLDLTSDDSIDFMKFLAAEAKTHDLAIGLKNAGDIIPDVLDIMDFSVNEQCVEHAECEVFADFTKAGKPVFHIEYPSGAGKDIDDKTKDDICSGQGDSAGRDEFSTVLKTMDLDGWVEYCDGKTYESKVGVKSSDSE